MLKKVMTAGVVSITLAVSLVACGGGGSTATGGAGAGTAAAGAATKGGAAPAAATGNLDNGKKLYDSNGCSACHVVKGQGGKVGPDLTKVGTRLSPDQISVQLKDPKQRPAPYSQASGGAVMPKPALNDAQVSDVTAYLASLKG